MRPFSRLPISTVSAYAPDRLNASNKIKLTDIAQYAPAQRHGKASGRFIKQCPNGQFWHIGSGYCYSCPSGMVRSARRIAGDKACMRLGALKQYSGAKLIMPGRPNGGFEHLSSGFYYACPPGFAKTVAAATSNKACKRVNVDFARAKSEPRGQIRNLANGLCFGAANNQLRIDANVVAQNCLDRDARFQSWYFDSMSRIRPLKQLGSDGRGAMCLEVVPSGRADPATKLVITACSRNAKPSQQWFVDQDFLLHSELDAGSCVSFSANAQLNSMMTLADCSRDENKKVQAWNFGSKLFKPVDVPAQDDENDGLRAENETATLRAIDRKRAEWAAAQEERAERRASARDERRGAAPVAGCQVCLYNRTRAISDRLGP